jgi:RNA recognition motif-containing protein
MSNESTLWMGDIEPWMNEKIILKSFADYGIRPVSVKMIKDKKLNILRNYCFINFDSMLEANRAIIQLNGKKWLNSNFIFRINWANENSEGNRNLYIGNLPKNVDDIELYTIFKSRYPSVHHASIKTDQGVSKGYGFVHFSEKEDYDNCLKEMNGFIIHNNVIKVKERIPKNEDKDRIVDEKDKNKIKNNININNISKINSVSKLIANNVNNNITNCNIFLKSFLNKRRKNKQVNDNKNNVNINLNCKINNNNYYINNNNSIYNSNMNKNFKNKISLINNQKRTEGASYKINDNDENNFLAREKDRDSSSSKSNSNSEEKRQFSYNIELLESNDEKSLNKKIQESVDKLFEHYKLYNKNSESKFIIL